MEGTEQEALDYIYNKSFLFKKRMGAHTPLHRRIPVCLPPAKLLQSCPTLCNPIAHQGPLSMGFSRQENWSQLPCPLPGNLPDPGIKPPSPSLQADSLPLSHRGSPYADIYICVYLSNCRLPGRKLSRTQQVN